MSQLNQFNGGLNTKIAPHLIGLNEGVIYKNVDNSSISLLPVKDDSSQGQNFSTNASFIYFSGQWIAKALATEYVIFQEVLYFSDGVTIPQKTSDGVNFYNLGIDAPSAKPTTVFNGTPAAGPDIRQYCYTYYNASDGSESAPSPYSLELEVSTNDVTVSDLVASTDPQVSNIRIYRLGGDHTQMTLVATVANVATPYNDTKSDLDISGSHLLDSYTAGQAPAGLLFLTESNAMLFGAIDDKLYYSDVAYPNFWNPFSYMDFDEPLTGIGRTQNGMLVFTKTKVYVITGNSPESLSKFLLHDTQGCINHKTIRYVNNTLLWLSIDGICASNGSSVKVITFEKLGKLTLVSVDSEVVDSQYFLFHSTGTLIVDFRYNNIIFKDLDVVAQGAWYSSQFDKLYYTDSAGDLYAMFKGNSTLTYTYKTGKISDGSVSMVKNYKDFYFFVNGTTQVKIYITGVLKLTHNLVDGFNNVKIPPSKGYFVELEFTGTGEVLEAEYKVEGRQNGD